MESLKSYMPRTFYFLAAVALLVLFAPRPAAADDVYNVDFTGIASCASASCSGATITGTYEYDTTSNLLVGPWSFNTPVGVVSGTGGDSVATSDNGGYEAGFSLLDFVTSDGSEGMELAFSGYPSFDGTLIGTNQPNSIDMVDEDPSVAVNFNDDVVDFTVTSGSAVGTLVATPEPSSLGLLGLGLFGLFILRRRRSASRLRLSQS
ncbi:MAG: PEP-CTERM sorting domain-containing protein [Candidatus Acidiferrales bacterium]